MDGTLKIIAVLLFLILMVMLDGAEAVKANISTLTSWALGLLVVWGVLSVAHSDAMDKRSPTQPWLYQYPLTIGSTALVLIIIAGLWMDGKAIRSIPFIEVAVCLLPLAGLVWVVETLQLAYPPGREARLLNAVRRGHTLMPDDSEWLQKRLINVCPGEPEYLGPVGSN
jgi:hypothetical protein